MFEQIVNLITRGVVALEIIAKHYETVGAAVDPKANGTAKNGKGKKDADPLAEMRDEIKQYAAIIAGGDDDDANDEFDDLLESFEIKSIAKLEDDDVEDFHTELKEIVETYFELED